MLVPVQIPARSLSERVAGGVPSPGEESVKVTKTKNTSDLIPPVNWALISLFTQGAVLIVFRVGESRRGLERNETRDIVPRHNVLSCDSDTHPRSPPTG